MKSLKNSFVRDSIFSLLPQRTNRRSQRRENPVQYSAGLVTVELNCHKAPWTSVDFLMGPRQQCAGNAEWFIQDALWDYFLPCEGIILNPYQTNCISWVLTRAGPQETCHRILGNRFGSLCDSHLLLRRCAFSSSPMATSLFPRSQDNHLRSSKRDR